MNATLLTGSPLRNRSSTRTLFHRRRMSYRAGMSAMRHADLPVYLNSIAESGRGILQFGQHLAVRRSRQLFRGQRSRFASIAPTHAVVRSSPSETQVPSVAVWTIVRETELLADTGESQAPVPQPRADQQRLAGRFCASLIIRRQQLNDCSWSVASNKAKPRARIPLGVAREPVQLPTLIIGTDRGNFNLSSCGRVQRAQRPARLHLEWLPAEMHWCFASLGMTTTFAVSNISKPNRHRTIWSAVVIREFHDSNFPRHAIRIFLDSGFDVDRWRCSLCDCSLGGAQ